MIFKTESGSTYEVDEIAKNFRRLTGALSRHIHLNGQWQAYVELQCRVGRPALVQFLGESRTLVTTRVTEMSP